MTARDATPELRLWGAAMALFLEDARRYQLGVKGPQEAQRAAWLDLRECGPVTQNFCMLLDLDPQWISEGFIRWCVS